jgi:NAD(P)-dependent dehydrogenase (short-subunit alcohol dehydrogenase family)
MQRIVITGANRGIGLEFCRQLAARGAEVFAVCRRASPGLAALEVKIIEDIDVADPKAVKHMADALQGVEVDVLINNAGILEADTLSDLDYDALRRQFEVNSLGPLRVTRALLENLQSPSQVVIVSSLMGSMSDNHSGGYYGYRMSKAAANAAGVSLARDLNPVDVSVSIVHPGMVATEMTGGRGIGVEESVTGMLEHIDKMSLSRTGEFWHANGTELKW